MGLFISGHNVGKNAASVLTLITVMYYPTFDSYQHMIDDLIYDFIMKSIKSSYAKFVNFSVKLQHIFSAAILNIEGVVNFIIFLYTDYI